MPTISRQRTRPGLRLVEASNFPAIIVVARPHDGDQVLVVVSDTEPVATIRGIGRLVLRDAERRCLARFLTGRRKR
jgi:hypothetical protein